MRQARDGRRVEERDDGDVVADLLLKPVDQHGPLDRVAAQLEEVVIDADLLDAQHLAPEARQEFLQGRARGDVGPGSRGPLVGRRGQGPAVHLAAGGAGQGRERDEGGRHHVLGQAILQVAPQRLGGERLAAGIADDIGDQPRRARRCPRATATAASRTDGWLSSADSTSPSSMR